MGRTAQDTPATADSAPPAAAKFKFQSQQLEDDPKRKKKKHASTTVKNKIYKQFEIF